MSKPEGYVGTLSVIWESGERGVFDIAQVGAEIRVGDHKVGPRNEKSIQGVVREISEIMTHPPQKVRQYTWLELVRPLVYPK
jgi:hypothetical protein